MWNNGWDKIFIDHAWGRYPSLEVVRFVSRHFLRQTPEKRKDIFVLDLGCGTGANLCFLAKEGLNTYGIDGSQVALSQLSQRLKEEQLVAELVKGDVTTLPFANSFFDCVIDCECLYANDLKDSHVILSEVARVLKPGGKFLSITFMTGTYGDGKGRSRPDEPNTYDEIYEGGFKKGYGVIRLTSEQDIEKLYGTHFKLVEVEHIVRSVQSRKFEIKEWVLVCEKPTE